MVLKHEVCEEVADRFRDFVRRFDNLDQIEDLGKEPTDYDYLLDYVMAWVERGDAIEWCAGDYGTFMSGVALIMARYAENPSFLDYDPDWTGKGEPRRVIGYMDFENDRASVLCMDRLFWDREVHRSRACNCSP